MIASLLLFTACGFAEWLLYGWRQRAVEKRLRSLAAFLVVLEVILGLWVTRQYVAGADLAGFCYAVGGGIGIFIGVGNKKAGPV